MRYILELSETQAKIVDRALEFYARMMCGQWKELLWHTVSAGSLADMDSASEHLLDARQRVFPLLERSWGHSYGAGKFRDADRAWEVHEVLRNKIAWVENPKGGRTVQFKRPFSVTGEPFAKCRTRKDD